MKNKFLKKSIFSNTNDYLKKLRSSFVPIRPSSFEDLPHDSPSDAETDTQHSQYEQQDRDFVKKKTMMADSLEKGLPHAISRVPASLAALSSLRLRYKAEPQRVSWALRKGFRYAGDNTRITPLFFEAPDVQAFGTVWHRGSLWIDV